MSLPRQIIPGTTYFLTRRCAFRMFLLRPSPQVNLSFLYVVAYAAERLAIQVHAACVMSNHWHCVFTDPEGNAPLFMEYVHRLTAKLVNTLLGRFENVWSSEPPSLIPLHSKIDIIDKIVYTLVNPVAAGLVPAGTLWPGLRIGPDQITVPLVAERPRIFFREQGAMPEETHLLVSTPRCWDDPSVYAHEIAKAVERKEEELRCNHRRKGSTFLGRRAALRQRPTDTPISSQKRRRLNPRIAAKSKWLRIEAVRRVKAFLVAYREAYKLWKNGIREAVFPLGTYALRKNSAVRCVDTC